MYFSLKKIDDMIKDHCRLSKHLISVNHGDRGVWTFTLRDSEKDFINVTVWGSTQFVKRLTSQFHIGSVGSYRISLYVCLI